MNLDSLSLALSQISFLVSNLNKKNYKSSVQEVQQVVERHGPEADRHLFRCLFSSIDFSGDGKSSGKDYYQTQLLILECSTLATKPSFISTLCHAIDSPLSHQKSLQPSVNLLQNISRILRFNKVQEVIFGIALQHSSIQEIRKHASDVVKTLFPEVIQLHLESIKVSGRGVNTQDIGLQDTAIEVLHTLLSYLVKNQEENSISAETKEAFLVTLRSNFPVERCPVVLLPLLYREKEDLHMDRLLQDANGNAIHKGRVGMADVLREIGYSACGSANDCRKVLMQYGVVVSAAQVAQALGMMSSTISEPLDNIPSLQDRQCEDGVNKPTSKSEASTVTICSTGFYKSLSVTGGWLEAKDKSDQYNSWNVENFVLALKDMNPNISFQAVVRELDYPHFVVSNAAAFQLLIRAIKCGVPPEERFPVDIFYKQWKNTNGQLSLIQQALLNPSVFCFADYKCHLCATDILKQPLDEDNKEIANWKSLNLVECLLQLSQNGHYEPVKMLFMWPAKHCPDLLMLSLLQITSPFHKLRQELISNLLPTFFNLHPNSGIILHCAWHGQGQCPAIRQLVMRSMADWYMRDQHEQQRLSRILDVAQDLKALSHLLNSTPFNFVIDLAVLASRREYLKLDKWLTDKIREHGETFVVACVSFLKKRSPSVLTGSDDGQPKNLQLPPETVATILVCLQSCAGNVSQPLTDTILGMVQNCSSLPKPRQAPPGILPTTRNTSAAPTSSGILPESIGSKAVSSDHGFSSVTTQPPTSQQNPQKDSNPLPNFAQLHNPGTPSSFASNVDSVLSLSNMTSGGPIGPMSGSVGSIGMPGQAHGDKMQGITGNSGLAVGGLMGIGGGGTVGQLGSQGPSGFSSSFVATSNNTGVSALGNAGVGPYSSQLGFGNQSMQGFGSSNQLLSDIGTLNFGDSPTDQFQSKMEQAFASQKSDLLNKKVLDLFGQPKLGNLNQSPGFRSFPQGIGSGLGGIGVGGDIFGQKKTTGAPLGQAAQQAFQQAGGLGATKFGGAGGTGGGFGSAVGGTVAGSDLSQAWPDVTQQFSKDIEDEANSYFQRIYNQPPDSNLSVDEILDLLNNFKDSHVKKEKEVFNCMLRNLFEEYRFFPQYPDKELYITACLFGGIIEKNLVPTFVVLGIALRYVLEALRKPQPNKMYYFGIAALDRFKNKLKDYPQYCLYIAGIPHFKDFPQHLIEFVENGKLSKDPPAQVLNAPQVMNPLQLSAMSPAAGSITPMPLQGRSTAILGPDVSSIAKATNIDTLLGAQESKKDILQPPEEVRNGVAFIFNNLSLSNVPLKSAEMKDFLKDEYIPWWTNYFVLQRISREHNFHQLYFNFLFALKMPKLNELVKEQVLGDIKTVLESDDIATSFSNRVLLKNLGNFLGLITLAINKPILTEEIDLKSMLYEANMKGASELLYVVPFVAKILVSVNKSRVFKLPNPWTESMLAVLIELHSVPDLKLNLKFEVEVLCKNLDININTIKPSHYLRDRSHQFKIDSQLTPIPTQSQSKPGTPSTGLVEQEQAQRVLPQNGMNLVSSSNIPSPAALTPVKNFNQQMMPSPMAQAPPGMPRFSLHDINIFSINTLQSHLIINQEILKNMPVSTHPLIKACVKTSVERAVQELLQAVVDRAITIAMNTCEQIVRKDFALDPEESRVRAAAHHMVRNLTAGLALIKCREPLIQTISNHLKNSLAQAMSRNGLSPPKEVVEQAVMMIAQDNMEVACCFIQKTAIEKALLEIDKRMSVEIEHRKHARQEGRRYCDAATLTYQAERMPEQIRLKVGGVTPQQTAVYEEFARCIPGFLPSNDASQPSGFLAKPMQTWPIDEVSQVFDRCAREVEQHIQAINLPPGNPIMTQLQSLSEGIASARNTREAIAALSLLQKAVEGLLERLQLSSNEEGQNVLTRYRECHVLVLKSIQDPKAYGPQWTNKHVTRCLVEHRDEYKYNGEAVDILIKTHLVNLQQYDMHLSQSMENGLNYMAVQFAMQLVKRYLIEEKRNTPVTETDLYNTVETLAKINAHNQGTAPEGLSQLVSIVHSSSDSIIDKVPGGPTHMMLSGISQAKEYDDPPGLKEKADYLLREWVNIFHSPASGRDSTRGFSNFVQQMHHHGILRTDDFITRFFRICTEVCVEMAYRLLQESNVNPSVLNPTVIRAKCFHTLDGYVRLITLLVKHSGDASNSVTKINLLNKVLGIVVGVLQQDHDRRHTEFHQMPYHRIFIMLFYELNAPEHVLESINFQTLTAFTNAYHILRPGKSPGFAFAWLELISYRSFIARMLLHTPQQKGWPMYAQLLIDLFKFLCPFLRNVDLTKPMQVLYRGTLRLLLVLLHDFPEFLCDYHYGFCDVIPANCVQLRNLILSAFPRNMRLPDPFTPNLKVDMLQEINSAPRILTNYVAAMPVTFKKELDTYLQSRSPVNFLSELRASLQVGTDSNMKYNVSLMNSLVLYIGTQAIQYIHNNGNTPSMASIPKCAHMDIFQHLSTDLDTEGRYLFLNAVANQLRYPNSHTHYFSCTLLYLFAEASNESIQEQITRVLLERLIVNRPHPWGLLITFIELIKNPSFNFWNHEFVHCAPEISKLFESVARSCMGKQFVQQAQRQIGPQSMASGQQGTAPSGIEAPASVTTTA